MISLLFAFILAITSSSPYYVAYIDYPTCGSSVTDSDCLAALGVPGYSDHNYNIINLAFYVTKSSWLADAVGVWTSPSSYFSQSFMNTITGETSASESSFRAALKSKYSAGGVKLLMSVFGATDDPISVGLSATTVASDIAEKVIAYNFDGCDLDFENTAYFDSSGTGEQWLVTLTTQLRSSLGDDYLITHAPMAPYFMGSPNYVYNGAGAYRYIHEQVGDKIDWYNVQFYNQGTTTYNTYTTLFDTSNGWSTGTAVNEIVSYGIPRSKIVIGKYVSSSDGSVGWVSSSNLKSWLSTYFTSYGQTAGFMLWQFPSDKELSFSFSDTIIEAFSSDSGSTNPTPTSSPITPSPVSSSSSSCSGSSDCILITNADATLSEWWYAAKVSQSNAVISTFQVLYQSSGTWYTVTCTENTWGSDTVYTCSATDAAFDYDSSPLTIRLTSTSGTVLTSWSLVSNSNANYAWNFGYNFDSSSYTYDVNEEDTDNKSNGWIIAVIVVAVILVIFLMFGLFYIVSRRRHRKLIQMVNDDEIEAEEMEKEREQNIEDETNNIKNETV